MPFNSDCRQQSTTTRRWGSPQPLPCFRQPLRRGWAQHPSFILSYINSKDADTLGGGRLTAKQSIPQNEIPGCLRIYSVKTNKMFILVSCPLLWTQTTLNTLSPAPTGVWNYNRQSKKLCACVCADAHVPSFYFSLVRVCIALSFAWK